MLKVDYTTNTFEGGKKMTFTKPTTTFTISNRYKAPGDYTPVWLSIQRLAEVREYLSSNPDETVKIFRYTPSVGVGNPVDWD